MPNVVIGGRLKHRFRIVSPLGRGGGGVVYRASDAILGREVALKTLDGLDPDQLYRLKHEFRTLRDLSHPNLAELYELIVDAEHCFFTMELLEGQLLLDFVRGDDPVGTLGEGALARLRHAFGQLAEAVAHLHACGHVHRDIKPGNVMVCHDGRVVLFDFGLAASYETRPSRPRGGEFAGTPDYISPEQAWGEAAVPASDWFSFGVSMYQALCGQLPVEGTLAERIYAKSRHPIHPKERATGVPPELDDLVCRLMSPKIDDRPGPSEVLAALVGVVSSPRIRPPARDHSPFVGRARELEQLAAFAARIADGAPQVVHVTGSSGIGKTELVRRFVQHLEADGRALVLRGRCHPQETVRFDAVDPLVDELTRFLQTLPKERVQGLLPRQAGALLRLFPSLGRVEAVAEAPHGVFPDDPMELRRLGARALRELLEQIAREGPVVLWIDDAHRGDRDSAQLIRELLRRPDPPRLMLILSYRNEDGTESPMLCELARLRGDGEDSDRVIEVGPLAPEESTQLAEALGRVSRATHSEQIEVVVREAAGSPFLMGELLRYAERIGAPEPGGRPDVDVANIGRVVRARLRDLETPSVELLELVSVAGRPIEVDLLLELSGVKGAGLPLIHALSRQCLLRSLVSDAAERVESYHDRIRETVLESLTEDLRRRRHRQLATGLARREPRDLHALVEHHTGAGEPEQAAAFALDAARAADEALAFDRAAHFYGVALELRGNRDSDWPTRVAHAEALGYAGLGARAGHAFEVAAAAAERMRPSGERRRRLVRRAGEHYLYSGRQEQGLALMSEILAELGVTLPRRPRVASLMLRARLLWRSRPYTRGAEPPAIAGVDAPGAPSTELLDALETAARGTTMQDHTLADYLSLRHLLGAIELGEPSRLAKALAVEASTEANIGGQWLSERSRRLLVSATRLAERTGSPYDRLTVLASEAAVAWFNSEWRACRRLGEAALGLLERGVRDEIPPESGGRRGTPWELLVVRNFMLGALYQLGCLEELGSILPDLVEDARARGDLFALSLLCANELVIVPLIRDEPDVAMREVEGSFVPSPEGRATTAHYHHLVGAVKVDLYAHRGPEAFARVEQSWKILDASGFLALAGVGLHLRYLRAFAALAAAYAGPATEAVRSRGPVAVAEREARRIARSPLSNGPPLAAAVRSALAGLRGDRSSQVAALGQSIVGFEATDMVLCAHAARLHLGRLSDDTDVRANATASERWMREQGVVNPTALAACTVPAPPPPR